jgi:hypothetical protein
VRVLRPIPSRHWRLAAHAPQPAWNVEHVGLCGLHGPPDTGRGQPGEGSVSRKKLFPNHAQLYRFPSPSEDKIRERRLAVGHTQEAAATEVKTATINWQRWEGAYSKMPPGLWELYVLKTTAILEQRALREAARELL